MKKIIEVINDPQLLRLHFGDDDLVEAAAGKTLTAEIGEEGAVVHEPDSPATRPFWLAPHLYTVERERWRRKRELHNS
tara:strand:+ start:396 stop:629 length:234 start_codon:yes stop_codon:yes gene_type:complete